MQKERKKYCLDCNIEVEEGTHEQKEHTEIGLEEYHKELIAIQTDKLQQLESQKVLFANVSADMTELKKFIETKLHNTEKVFAALNQLLTNIQKLTDRLAAANAAIQNADADKAEPILDAADFMSESVQLKNQLSKITENEVIWRIGEVYGLQLMVRVACLQQDDLRVRLAKLKEKLAEEEKKPQPQVDRNPSGEPTKKPEPVAPVRRDSVGRAQSLPNRALEEGLNPTPGAQIETGDILTRFADFMAQMKGGMDSLFRYLKVHNPKAPAPLVSKEVQRGQVASPAIASHKPKAPVPERGVKDVILHATAQTHNAQQIMDNNTDIPPIRKNPATQHYPSINPIQAPTHAPPAKYNEVILKSQTHLMELTRIIQQLRMINNLPEIHKELSTLSSLVTELNRTLNIGLDNSAQKGLVLERPRGNQRVPTPAASEESKRRVSQSHVLPCPKCSSMLTALCAGCQTAICPRCTKPGCGALSTNKLCQALYCVTCQETQLWSCAQCESKHCNAHVCPVCKVVNFCPQQGLGACKCKIQKCPDCIRKCKCQTRTVHKPAKKQPQVLVKVANTAPRDTRGQNV